MDNKRKPTPEELFAYQLQGGAAVPAAFETDESNEENALKQAEAEAKLRALRALQGN